MMNLQQVFNNNGDFIDQGYDPYRRREQDTEIHNFLFDEDGSLNEKLWFDNVLSEFIRENNCPWCSDIVKLYWAQEMGINTKGSYPAIYMWR